MKKRNSRPSGVSELKVGSVVIAMIAEFAVQRIVGDGNASRNKEIFVQIGDGPSAANVVVDF